MKNLRTKDYHGYPFAIFNAKNHTKMGMSLKIFRDKKYFFSIESLVSIVGYKFLSASR